MIGKQIRRAHPHLDLQDVSKTYIVGLSKVASYYSCSKNCHLLYNLDWILYWVIERDGKINCPVQKTL